MRNTIYFSVNGVLYKKVTGGSQLIAYPEGRKDTVLKVQEGTVSIGEEVLSYCTDLVEIVLPNTVKSIGFYAFGDCTSLQKINLPNGITEIGEYAFANVENIKKIVFPHAMTTLSANLLNNVTTATIQENVTTIEEQESFNNLETLYFAGEVPENIENVFPIEDDDKITIYYPSGNKTWDSIVAKYKQSNITWKKHTHTVNSTWVEDWEATKDTDGQSSQR